MSKGLPIEHRIVLNHVGWQKYEALLAEIGEKQTTRFTYDRSRLEMMTPLDEHDRCHNLIESLILVLAKDVGFRVRSYKAPILKCADLKIGTAPDTAYYVQHEADVRGKPVIDLTIDPPPDLILDVSLDASATDKLPLYAALGVSEVWRYISKPGTDFFKGTLLAYCWTGDRYRESHHSLAFPFLPLSKVNEFIKQTNSLGPIQAIQILQDWLQTQNG